MIKNKKLNTLKEILLSQKEKYKITESFSYRFDSRTKRLILCYTTTQMVRKNGEVKVKRVNREKYKSNINQDNFRKYFKGSTTIVRDDAVFVKKMREKSEEKYEVGLDEKDFLWWIETFLSRGVGQTKTIKRLSPLTIKQNKYHLNEYFEWCVNKHSDSVDIDYHIDMGANMFEKYYEEKLTSGRWSPSTIGISFRNIRGFYNFIADRSRGKFPYDILRRLKVPQAQHSRDTINSFEYDKILDFIVSKSEDVFWGKFLLMLRLQLKTGMRCGEVVNIQNRNIDEPNKQIHIIGKGEKSRVLNFGHEDDEKIWTDILEKKHKGIYLFHRTRIQFYPKQKHKIEVDIDINLPTTSSYYLQRFRTMRTLLDLRGKGVVTSHSLRRYFITRFVKETNNRDLVRQIVGHSSTRMTDYYVGSMIEQDTKTTISLGI